jgi:amino acid adenylation domain-containing protein
MSEIRQARPDTGVAPTSFAQQRLWFIDQLEQGETAYSVLIPTRLRGPLDADALAASLTAVVARHEILRTTYTAVAGEPVQVVHPPAPVPLPLTDLSALTPELRREAVHRTVREEETQPFDLAAGPLVRARLLRLGADDHVLLCGVHHIAVDVPSIHLLYDELAAGYNARARGEEPLLPALPVQYSDYASWERTRMQGPERDRLLAYWRRQLDGLAPLDLPADRPAPDVASGRGGFQDRDLPVDLISGLEALAAAEGVTLFDVLVAGLVAVLARYTGQDDIAVGTVVHRRPLPELRPLIGFFANTLVLRVDVSGAPTFRELVARVAEVVRTAREHDELPFDAVVHELAPRRESNRTPLFRVYFGLDETPEVLPRFGGLDAQGMLPDFSTAKFDLGFKVRARFHDSSPPKLFSIFSVDLFDDDRINRMLGHVLTLLEEGVADPDRRVTRLPMLTRAERHDVLVTWNDTERPFPDQSCLHELFEGWVADRGEAAAVVCAGETLTYGELEAQANRLAHRLRALGVGRDTVVGVCLRRSVRQAVAVLGVLKAGGAFLPLDPEYPADRLGFMLADSGAWGVLTEQRLLDRFAAATPGHGPDRGSHEPGRGHVLVLDAEDLDAEPTARPESLATPDDLAYVIYTSGSTGTPKGIELRHRGAVNNFTDFNERFAIGPGDAVLGVSSPSFDMSVYDLLGMVGAGGTLVLPAPEEVREPRQWARLIAEHAVTVWHSAPALLELLVEHLGRQSDQDGEQGGGDRTAPRASGPLPLRLALLGGDWIAVSLPDRFRALAPGAQVVALGGATEASMDSTIFLVGEVDPAWASIPYGRPMANQRAYVLDRYLEPLPVGVPGELYLAGAGLARGYRGRPELTAERFVEHAFTGGTPDGRHERLYRTGDQARYRADGVLELLGRTDFQVKVHGLRIELGEIEAVLRRHPAVADAVVVARGERGRTTLAAFVRPAGPSADRPAAPPDRPDPPDHADRPGQEELRCWLRTSLPDHMVPADIVTLEELPTGPNGKVDRRALSTWEPARDSSGLPPRDPVEAGIAAVWREVLGRDRIGIDDDFFHLGGDSFAAVRTMLALDSPVPVVELFKNPTVRTLAARIRTVRTGQARLLYELTPAGRDAELTLVCLPYGGGNAVNYRQLAEALPLRFALWAAALPGHDPGTRYQPFLLAGDAARRLADEVAERISGPIVVYGHCAGATTGIELARALQERGADLRTVYVAGSLPDPDPAGSLRRADEMSDREYADHLAGIGGFAGALDSVEVEIIMRAGRHDMVEATRFFQRGPDDGAPRLELPLHCVIGDADPTTDGFASRYLDWAPYAASLDLSVIRGGGHYFIRDHAGELAALIDAQLGACASRRPL